MSAILHLPPDRFEFAGEWLLKDAQINDVSFELWLQDRDVGPAANFWLSDARFKLECCRNILNSIFGLAEEVQGKKKSSKWITYQDTDSLRQATFIFGEAEGSLYLEMIVVG